MNKNNDLQSSNGASDYERIAQAVNFITEHSYSQPGLEEIAASVNMSPFHFHRLFSQWAGVTPKRFLQILTVERAKELLELSLPVLDAAYSTGLSSGSRLYDHFVQLEAVSPGEYKLKGKGLTVEYAFLPSPFGKVFLAVTQRGISRLQFIDDDNLSNLVLDLKEQWPLSDVRENKQKGELILNSIFSQADKPEKPLSLYVKGTNFQVNVWKALLQIPPGCLASYNCIARAVDKPKASRAVGTAIGRNPVAFLIPCHRVIQQSGKIGGYRWGEKRKHAIHAWESAVFDEPGINNPSGQTNPQGTGSSTRK